MQAQGSAGCQGFGCHFHGGGYQAKLMAGEVVVGRKGRKKKAKTRETDDGKTRR